MREITIGQLTKEEAERIERYAQLPWSRIFMDYGVYHPDVDLYKVEIRIVGASSERKKETVGGLMKLLSEIAISS